MRVPTKFPTFVGLFLLVAIVTIVSVFDRQTSQQTNASATTEPREVNVSNITDISFTVSWITNDPSNGSLIVSSQSQKETSFIDERDSSGNIGKHTTHSVTTSSLKPAALYRFSILSNGKRYQSGAIAFEVQLGQSLAPEGNGLEPAYGSIFTPENQPAKEAIVYLALEGGQLLSALTKPSGTWLIPLNLARTTALAAYLVPSERVVEQITVRLVDQVATAITDTLNDAPVPIMVLGKTYDFRGVQAKNTSPLAHIPEKQKEAVLGQQVGRTLPQTFTVQLIQPPNGAKLTTNLPMIAGSGIPGKRVVISLGITAPTSGTTMVRNDGLWKYTPAKALGAGKQLVTMTSFDAEGQPIAMTHSFEVLKSGTQVLGDATPSATLTPTIFLEPTVIPTVNLFPTPSSTLSGEPLQQPGTTLPTILLLLVGISFLTGGTLLFIK